MKEKRKYADRAEYIKKAVSKRRKKIKDIAIKYKGGKCILCGYKKCEDALQFHPGPFHDIAAVQHSFDLSVFHKFSVAQNRLTRY